MLTWSWLASATAKRHQSGQPIVRLMDGSPTLWDSADACLAEFVDERREAKKPVTVVRRRATVSAVNEADAKVIATVCGYLENNASRMRYDVYLSAGYPIATG